MSLRGSNLPTEDEIREVCMRVSLAATPAEFKAALSELKIAIREHITDTENLGIHMLMNMPKAKAAKKDGTND